MKNIRESKLSQSSSYHKVITNGRNVSHSDSEPDLNFALHPKQGTAFDTTTTQFKYSKWLHSFIANTLIITQIGCILGLLYGAFIYKYGSFLFVSTFYGYICHINTSHSVKLHQDKFAVTCFILFLSCIVSTLLYYKFIWSKYGKLFVEKDEQQSITYLNTEQIISFLQKTLSDKKQSSSRCFHLFLASYIVAKNLHSFDIEATHSIMGTAFESDKEHPYISRLNQSFSSISTVNKSPSKVRKMSPANKYFKYRNNANNRKIIKIRRQQQKTLAKQLKKNKKKVKMNLLKRRVKHLLIFSHFCIATMISWFDFGYLFVLYVSSNKQGYNFNEREIALILLVPYCTLMIWIPVGSKIFYVFMNAERRYYILLLSIFCVLFISSTFISTLFLENNNIKYSEYYTWITLICSRAIMTILLSSILAMIDYKLHQLLLTYSVIVLQIDHVDYFSMSISLMILIILIFAIDQMNFDKYLFSITYIVIIFCLLLCTIIPYIICEMILYGKYNKNNTKNIKDSNAYAGGNSYKVLLSKSYRKRKQKWRTKIHTLQNYVYIRSLLSHYDRTPNTTPSLTLALQHVKLRKKKNNNKLASSGGASSSVMSSQYVITQTTSDISANIQNGSHSNDDFALVFSSTSHTNYTNIEYMDANMTPSFNNLRKTTFSQTYDQTPYREAEMDDDTLIIGVDDDKILQQQQDKEQSFKLAQQIISIAGQSSEEMKLNISTLQTIQIAGLNVGINEPDKYISDIDCIIAAIISLYNQYFRYYSMNDRFLMEGRLHFDASLRSKIKKGEAIHMIYIGFPFKFYQFDDDNNEDLDYEYLSGVDITDLFILHRLNEFCMKINEIYAYKSYCSIISMAPFIMDVIYDRFNNKNKIKINFFCQLIINYYFKLGKIINDGNKEDDLFEYLEWYDVLRINAENKYNENTMDFTDTDTDNFTDTYDEDMKMLNRFKHLVESFSLQHKLFSSTIFNALKSNNNLKQIFLKLNDWINMLPINIMIRNDKKKEVEILNEKAISLLKSYLRLLVYIESQLKHSIIFSSMASNNECSQIIFSSFQSCKLGFTLSLFQINNQQYNLDKLNYYNCYASNQIIFVIDDINASTSDNNNINISFIPLNVLNFTDFEWKKNKNITNNNYEYIVFSLDGSLKFKMIKLSNIRNKNAKICNRILKAWKLKECVFDIQEYYCLQMQYTK